MKSVWILQASLQNRPVMSGQTSVANPILIRKHRPAMAIFTKNLASALCPFLLIGVLSRQQLIQLSSHLNAYI